MFLHFQQQCNFWGDEGNSVLMLAFSYSVFIVVGVLWGSTNPLIRRGILRVQEQRAKRWTGYPSLDAALHHLATPAFVVPQLLNLGGSVLFAASLGAGSISIAVPLANGVSLAANAVADRILGDSFELAPGLVGLTLVLCGVTLCTQSTAAA